MEKKTTMPPSVVARTAPCSAPGTSTQTTVTSAGVPTAAATASGSVASATTTRSASPAAVSAAASASLRTRPVSRVAPAARAAASDRDPDLPAAPMTTTVFAAALSTTRGGAAGAPQTSRTARDNASGRSSGRTAAIERANRMAVPSAGTCSERPSQRASPSVIRSGVRVSDTRVATRCPTGGPGGRPERAGAGGRGPDGVDDADEHAAGAGDRVLHLSAAPDDLQDGRAHGLAVAAAGLGELPERSGVKVQSLYRDAHLVRADRRVGVQPVGGLGQHSRRLQHP